MIVHELKCYTLNFKPISKELKRGDIRENDRNFQAGDQILYREGLNGLQGYQYTGASCTALITHVSDLFLPKGMVLLSLKVLNVKGVEMED